MSKPEPRIGSTTTNKGGPKKTNESNDLDGDIEMLFPE